MSHTSVGFVGIGLVAALLAGCGKDFQQQVETFATPTKALASDNAELVREVRAIQQARGLASQLDRPEANPETNAAAAFAEGYSDDLHLRLTPIVQPLIEPTSPVGAEARKAFLRREVLLLDKTGSIIDLPRCQFEVAHRHGFFARMRYLDDAVLASRLMLVRTLHRAAEADLDGAMDDLLRSLRVTHWLSQVRRVEARVLAVRLRQEAFEVASAQFEGRIFRRHEAERLYGALREQLTDWPTERDMLLGDRATVIHAYEAIRAGLLHRLMTQDERTRLSQTDHLQRMRGADAEAIDQDQAYYLAAMGTLLSIADEPHAPRQPAIATALGKLSERPTLFARALFTRDLPDAMQLVAVDRAQCEGWTIALAAAAGLRTPPFRNSPLSGLPYEVDRDANRVEVIHGKSETDTVGLPVLTTL